MTAFTNAEPIEVINRKSKSNAMAGWKYTILKATEIADGAIEVNFAEPISYNQINGNTTEAVCSIEHGIYTEMGGAIPTAHGIDMDQVKVVIGKTYDIKNWLKSLGFKWNADFKAWAR